MADYYQLKNSSIFNPPANTNLGNSTNQFGNVFVQNNLNLGNVTVTSQTIVTPKVSTIGYPGDDTAADTAGGQTITLTGSGFTAGASVLINGSAVGVVSVVSSTTITFTSPANSTGSYVIYVINPDGATAISIPGIQYSGTPNWTTAAGSLGGVYETASFNQTVTATGDAPITYAVTSGALPPGATFNSNGTITGTSQLLSSPTTYTFTVRATDAQQQDTDRSFSIVINPDVVTWSNPTNNQTYTPAANIAIANITLSATSAVGSGITYSANTLPTGLSLTGANISGTPTVQANTSSLLTATANTTSESSSITINWVVSVASDPYFMYNSLLLPGTGTNGAQNNTFLDGSTNNFTITRNGNTTQGTFSPYGPNWSNYFNGGGGATLVGLTNSSMTAVGTGICTVELWVNLSSTGVDQHFYDLGTNGFSIYFAFETNKFGVYNRVTSTEIFGSYSVTSTYNNWYHLAFVRSGTGTNQTAFYVNGVLSGTATNNTNFTSTSVTIGSRFAVLSSVAYGALGYLSNVRYTNTAVYSSAFTPSTAPLTAISGTRLLTCQSNRFIDNSSNALVLTVNGAPTVQRFSPFSPGATYSAGTIGGSGYFDGSGDYVYAAANAAFNIGSNSASVEMWCYSTSSAVDVSLCGQNSGPYSTIRLLQLSGNYAYTVNDDTIRTTGIPVTLNAWMHIVVTITGGTGRMFINGVLRNVTTGLASVRTQSDAYVIGAEEGIANYYTGYMTDFRFVNGSIPTAYQTSSVTTGTTIFTPPTAPLAAVANTSLLLNFTNAGIIDNTMINNLETVGNAQISTAQSKFGSGSMAFDGTGDYLTIPSTPNLAFSGNFTCECWLYLLAYPANSNAMYIMDFRNGSTNNFGFGVIGIGGVAKPYMFVGAGPVDATGTTTLSLNTWYNIAVVRSGSTVTYYLNGVSNATFTTSFSQAATGVTIGARYTGTMEYVNGYIDDLRITKGYARYTANFTPPTTAFPTY
jgi:hypothetical protein